MTDRDPKSSPGAPDDTAGDRAGGSLNAIPELMRRVFAAGLSGFFLTEEAVRKAVGETLPQDWVDFAASQSERTRRELLERLSLELGRSLESLDLADVLSKLLSGRTIEVRGEFRLLPEGEGGPSKLRVTDRGDPEPGA